jgi:hypothetical protein
MSMERLEAGAAQDGALIEFFKYACQVGARPAGRGRLRLRGVVLLAACLIGGAILSRNGGQSPVAAPAAGPSHIAFVANERLAPMVSFSPPDAIRAPLHYQARMRENSTERWDTLTFGDAGGNEILFRVTLRAAKSAGSALPRSSLFVELAKQSAEIGAAVVHATNPEFFSTSRGPIEWAEVTLAGAMGERPCLGFRLDRLREIDLSGLACGAHGATLDRVALGRLIDRLSATGSGRELGLGEVLKSGAT